MEALSTVVTGSGKVSIGGRLYELVVKTEWKNWLKRDALSKSVVAEDALN